MSDDKKDLQIRELQREVTRWQDAFTIAYTFIVKTAAGELCLQYGTPLEFGFAIADRSLEKESAIEMLRNGRTGSPYQHLSDAEWSKSS